MGNSESSSQFPPPSNNDDGNNNKTPNPKEEEEEEGLTASSALKIGAAVAGSALFALGAYKLASSSSSSHSSDSGNAQKRVAQLQDLEPQGFSSSSIPSRIVTEGLSPRLASRSIKIMSYNVWFREDVEVHERMAAIGQLIEEHNPDIIFFQEVTPNIYGIFQSSNWWRIYRCSVPPEKAITRRYFCMLLSKLPVKRFICKPFQNSNMGRELCVAEIDAGMHKNLFVATSHLESPTPPEMNSIKRVAQAKEALSLLDSAPNVVFGGDMNWDEVTDGPFPLGSGWQDAWCVLRPGENGWTFDTRSNGMLKGNRPLWKRLDRFVCKLQDFRMERIDMIGRDAIPGISYYNIKGKELPVLPSDHYGLVLTICPI